jgi:uncharacterized protein YqkB
LTEEKDAISVKKYFQVIPGRGLGLVVKAAGWQAGDPGSIFGQRQPLYIWMYTPSAVSILRMDMCKSSYFIFIFKQRMVILLCKELEGTGCTVNGVGRYWVYSEWSWRVLGVQCKELEGTGCTVNGVGRYWVYSEWSVSCDVQAQARPPEIPWRSTP